MSNSEKIPCCHSETRPEENDPKRTFLPDVDVIEREDGVTLLVDLPGVAREDLRVDFDERTLSILGSRKRRKAADHPYFMEESEAGEFYRSFRLSERIDSQGISASLADGVLELSLPRHDRAKARRIDIA